MSESSEPNERPLPNELRPAGDLVVVHRSFPIGTDVDDVVSGKAVADRVDLAADGKPWEMVLATEAQHLGGDLVYVEHHEADGSGMHGWVDAGSRRLVQIG